VPERNRVVLTFAVHDQDSCLREAGTPKSTGGVRQVVSHADDRRQTGNVAKLTGQNILDTESPVAFADISNCGITPTYRHAVDIRRVCPYASKALKN